MSGEYVEGPWFDEHLDGERVGGEGVEYDVRLPEEKPRRDIGAVGLELVGRDDEGEIL